MSFYLGQMNLEEFTAFVSEDIERFEQLTNVRLTEDDLRIISMNRFESIERSMTRHLTESEYRHLLQTNLVFDYIEQELLKRPLTTEERIEQEELFVIKTSKVTEGLEQVNKSLIDIIKILISLLSIDSPRTSRTCRSI
jgi:hypothetical protein